MIHRQGYSGSIQPPPQSHGLMNISCLPLLGLLLALALAFGIVSCTPAEPVTEAEYGAKIVGNWLGTVGDMKESIYFNADGNFIAQLRPGDSSATRFPRASPAQSVVRGSSMARTSPCKSLARRMSVSRTAQHRAPFWPSARTSFR